jgi:transposase
VALFLAVGATDLRGAFDRLAAVTRQVLQMDPASGALFLFINRRRNRLKALWWDRNGYTILYKRLARGTFHLPDVPAGGIAQVAISQADFARLVAGLPLTGEPPPPTVH